MTERDLLDRATARLPDFAPTGETMRLPGGLLNEVWRVNGRAQSTPSSLVAKHAPPHIASQPEVPLDPERVAFEARALRAFAPGGALADLATEATRPPRPLDYDAATHTLLMEDLGTPPALGAWLRGGPPAQDAQAVGKRLGRFVGRLHARTRGDDALREAFDNRAMQETRHAVQYRAVGELCEAGGAPDAEALGARAEAMGKRFIEPGDCLVMGDLWPPSVLLREPSGSALRLIDWELCHYGRPAQDVAHLAAHLWMHAHRAPSREACTAAEAAQRAFLDAYRDALGEAAATLLTPQALADCAVHFGAEILVRAVGPFQAGYLYDGLAPDASPVRTATRVAAGHLREPEAQETFAALAP
ncbi:MAG: phosphotransferase [Bacteroidetes bacterium QS_9_68_14]|nr:MAG: phosphotransferase [Bacteroidetes bacterium QS_9_68_14]